MIKDAIIKIEGIQEIDSEKEKIEFTTEGRFGIKDGKYYIFYDESRMIEDGNVKTQVVIHPTDGVVLQRNGSINSRMEIQNGKRNSCFYSTPHGELCIGVYGEKITADLNKSGGMLEMVYTVDTDMRLLSRNTVKITVKEV